MTLKPVFSVLRRESCQLADDVYSHTRITRSSAFNAWSAAVAVVAASLGGAEIILSMNVCGCVCP